MFACLFVCLSVCLSVITCAVYEQSSAPLVIYDVSYRHSSRLYNIIYSQCIANYWPCCRYSPTYCLIAASHKSEIQKSRLRTHTSSQLQTGCFSRNLSIQFCFRLSFRMLMPYVWLCLLKAQLLLLFPIRWKLSLHCREGSTLSAHENACVYSAFPASFSARSRFILILQQRFTPTIILYNDSSSVPINHGIAATLAYVNQELTNTTLVSLVSPRGPYGREEEHAMRY